MQICKSYFLSPKLVHWLYMMEIRPIGIQAKIVWWQKAQQVRITSKFTSSKLTTLTHYCVKEGHITEQSPNIHFDSMLKMLLKII